MCKALLLVPLYNHVQTTTISYTCVRVCIINKEKTTWKRQQRKKKKKILFNQYDHHRETKITHKEIDNQSGRNGLD